MPITQEILSSSITYLEQAARLYPGNRRYLVLLGEAYLLRGDLDAALAPLMAGIDTEDPPRAVYLLALTLLGQGRLEEAIEHASTALASSPLFHRALYVRARAYYGLGRHREALGDVETAVALAPDRAEYRLARIRILIRDAYARPEHRERLLLRALSALEEAPPSPRASGERAFLRGLVHIGLGQLDRALDFLDTTSFPTADESLYRRGLCHLAIGRPQAARDTLRRVREPHLAASAREHLARIEQGDPVNVTADLAAPPPDATLWPDPCDPRIELLHDALDLMSLRPMRGIDDPSRERPLLPDLEILEGSAANRRLSEITYNLERGRALMLEGRHKKAQRLLEIAWELTRNDEVRRTSAGREMLESVAEGLVLSSRLAGGPDLIATRGEEFLAAGYRDPRFLEEVCSVFLKERRVDEASLDAMIALFERGGPKDATLRSRLLRTLAFALHVRITDDPSKVAVHVPSLKRLHAAVPNLSFPRLYLGRYFYLNGDFQRARRYFDGIRGHLASSPRLLTLRGRCAEKLDALDEALDLYQKALTKNHHLPHVHFRIGRLLLQRYVSSAG